MIKSKLAVTGLAILAAFGGTAQAHENEACHEQATLISKIQGSGKTSPMVGKQVSVRAVVSAVKPGMGGFYLQQPKVQWDANDETSEGIFVRNKSHKPSVGDLVAVSAKVAEFKDFTQLEKVSSFSVCGSGNKVEAQVVNLPFADKNQMESVEGMLVVLPQTLTISENYGLARYGQLLVSNGRLFVPSNIEKPGSEAIRKLSARNRLNQIIIDDSSTEQNPPIGFGFDHSYRVGNSVKGVRGVVHYGFGKYMIEPTAPYEVLITNEREPKPVVKTKGQLRVASFNVLNYFNGDGAEKAFPTKRGANSKAEFVRQDAKIVAAMKTIGADVLGLMEVENDGYGPNSAIAELTQNLAKASGLNYVFVRPQTDKLGDDAIAVGMIYNADKVKLVGHAVTLTEAPFGRKSRQPLAQTFKDNTSGESFTLVVNHFKSKGGCPKDKTDPNAAQRDGQACWNVSRTIAAQKLAKWLSSNPTGSNDKDVLIIGDLNAYAKEDPVMALERAGFTNLIDQYQGKAAYSYVYRGVAGYLDHALASKSLAAQVVDATDWHINADEMRITDYNLEHKSMKQQSALFHADGFRSSDHDPMIVELTLK